LTIRDSAVRELTSNHRVFQTSGWFMYSYAASLVLHCDSTDSNNSTTRRHDDLARSTTGPRFGATRRHDGGRCLQQLARHHHHHHRLLQVAVWRRVHEMIRSADELASSIGGGNRVTCRLGPWNSKRGGVQSQWTELDGRHG